jgi:hypothetical protein
MGSCPLVATVNGKGLQSLQDATQGAGTYPNMVPSAPARQTQGRLRPLSQQAVRHWLIETGLAREHEGRLVLTALGRDVIAALTDD